MKIELTIEEFKALFSVAEAKRTPRLVAAPMTRSEPEGQPLDDGRMPCDRCGKRVGILYGEEGARWCGTCTYGPRPEERREHEQEQQVGSSSSEPEKSDYWERRYGAPGMDRKVEQIMQRDRELDERIRAEREMP